MNNYDLNRFSEKDHRSITVFSKKPDLYDARDALWSNQGKKHYLKAAAAVGEIHDMAKILTISLL